MEKYREVVGHIIKEEKISLLNHQILPNSVVVNIDHPFPGFHGWDFDLAAKPRSIIILTAQLYSWAKILRWQASVNQNTDLNIYASFAKLIIGKTIYYGIRIKGLCHYNQIPELQKDLEKHGFELLKNKNLKTDRPVSIKISKFFHIKNLDNQIFADETIEHMYYIEIPQYLSWENFRQSTAHVKQNVSNHNFDVAKGLFYKDDTVKDIIRIFKPKMSLDLLQEIKNRYEQAIKKL